MSIDIRVHTRQFVEKDNRVAALSYFGTFAVYFTSFFLAATYAATWWILVPMGAIMALAAVRLYVLQHDCGHHSLFETRQQNELAGHGPVDPIIPTGTLRRGAGQGDRRPGG